LAPRECLLLQDNRQEGVDVNTAIASNEALITELLYEEVDSGTRSPGHFRKHPLRNVGEHLLGCVFAAIAREQKKSGLAVFRWSLEADRSSPPRCGCSEKA